MRRAGFQDQERRLDGRPYSRRHYARAVILSLPGCGRLSGRPAAVQADRDWRQRIAVRSDGIENCWAFYVACLLYAAATVLWVWILTKLPLSTAYPFVGLSFVMVALAGWCFLGRTAFDTGLDRRSDGCRSCGARCQFSWRKILNPKIALTANNVVDLDQTISHRSPGVFSRQRAYRAKLDADHLGSRR